MNRCRPTMNALSDSIFTNIIYREEVESTNTAAMSYADNGEKEGLVIIADAQTSGRGRLGRSWYSPSRKNVYMSLLLRPHMEVADLPILGLLTGVSACKALGQISGENVKGKWPNDIMLNGKKIGGVLIDARIENAVASVVVVGIGVNVNMQNHHMADELKDTATSLFVETGRRFNRHKIIVVILKEFDYLYKSWRRHVPGNQKVTVDPVWKAKIINTWKGLDIILGSEVSVMTPRGAVVGRAVEINQSGMLQIMTDKGESKLVSSGDASVVK